MLPPTLADVADFLLQTPLKSGVAAETDVWRSGNSEINKSLARAAQASPTQLISGAL